MKVPQSSVNAMRKFPPRTSTDLRDARRSNPGPVRMPREPGLYIDKLTSDAS